MSTTFWSQQKVLVTGGSGFLGSHLCRRLVEFGAEVHATSRATKTQQESEIRWWQTDLADMPATRDLLATVKPDVIYHLAGSVSASPARELVPLTFHSLLVSTVNLLTAVTEIGCLPSHLDRVADRAGSEPSRSDACFSLCGGEMGGERLWAHVSCALWHADRYSPSLYDLWAGTR